MDGTHAWLTAIQALTLVAEHGGGTILPRVDMMRALHASSAVPPPERRRQRAKAYKLIR
jgi:hypothetical protein